MKKRHSLNLTKKHGYYIAEFIEGFMGEQNEGAELLRQLGVSDKTLPFSVINYLKKKSAVWLDAEGNRVQMTFKLKADQFECQCKYKGLKKSFRIFKEWGINEDEVMINKLESEAIGNLTMQCLYEIAKK